MQSAATPTASTSVPSVAKAQPGTGLFWDRAVGVLLMSVVPAAFWTGMGAVMTPLLGFELEAATLLQTGAGIALFLAVVAGAVTSRRS